MTKFTLLALLFIPLFALDGKVIKVSDGDTITILTDDKEQIKIRLFGIDAPEKKQAYGNKAKQFLSDLIAGQDVYIEEHSKDRYKRVLGIVWLDDEDINAQMVLNGYAWAFKRYSKDYVLHEIQAKREKQGLWQDKEPIAPWEFRKKR